VIPACDTTASDSLPLAERGRREGAQIIVDVAGEMAHGYIGLCCQLRIGSTSGVLG